MKRITLIKTFPEIQVAHVYEHLYCAAIRQLFAKQALLYYLDYTYQGRTYDNGLLYIQVSAYSPDAAKLIQKITSLKPKFEVNNIERTLSQIVAEEKYLLHGLHIQKLLGSLAKLHEQPWQLLEDLAVIDVKNQRRSRRQLWITDKPAATKTLHCSLVLDNEFAKAQPNLLPLFDEVAGILQANLTRELADHFGYYREDTSYTYTKNTAKTSQRLISWTRFIPHLTTEASFAKKYIASLAPQFIAKTQQFLAEATYTKDFQAPDELTVFESTNVIIGATGWRTLGTEANIRKVLAHTTLQFTYGREKQSAALT